MRVYVGLTLLYARRTAVPLWGGKRTAYRFRGWPSNRDCGSTCGSKQKGSPFYCCKEQPYVRTIITLIPSVLSPRSECSPVGVNPFRTAVPFWWQITWNLTRLSPERDCGSEGVYTCLVQARQHAWYWTRHLLLLIVVPGIHQSTCIGV